MVGRAARKQAEITAKLRGIETEFAEWQEASAEGGPLERHHTQVRAVVGAFTAALEYIRPGDESGRSVLETWTRTEDRLLGLHEVWGFFREKFALRFVEMFERYLRLADDFAYACYRPAQQLGAGPHNVPADAVREPPLVFLSRVSTPFAIPRGDSYAAEVRPTTMSGKRFRQQLQHLPVPLIGVPWFQLRHLPDALVIGHEVGHHVERDFGLADRLHRLVEDALAGAGTPPGRRAAWHGWLSEVFGDVYGVLAAGPAFPCVLADFVATGHAADAGSAGYPPADIRVRVAAAASARTRPAGFDERDPDWEGDLLTRWYADFPAGTAVSFHDDVSAVVTALLDGPYPQFGGRTLPDVLTFADRRRAADAHATALLGNDTLDPGIDIRGLLAAAGLAFARDPGRYQNGDVTTRILEHASRIESKGLRARAPDAALPGRDLAAGRTLAASLAARSHPGRVE